MPAVVLCWLACAGVCVAFWGLVAWSVARWLLA